MNETNSKPADAPVQEQAGEQRLPITSDQQRQPVERCPWENFKLSKDLGC